MIGGKDMFRNGIDWICREESESHGTTVGETEPGAGRTGPIRDNKSHPPGVLTARVP